MEQSHEELSDLMARRLVEQTDQILGDANATEEKKTGIPMKRGGDTEHVVAVQTAPEPQESFDAAAADLALPATFTKVEKSLASLGFFTPSSKRLKDKKVKRIGFTREIDGKRVDVTAEIVPSALFGLPITADQDKYLALQKIITNILQTNGKIENPIKFRSADLLHLLGRTDAGKNYNDIGEWLAVMMSTTIFSQGVVYKAGEKKFAKDIFHVFDRVVSIGKELPDGTIADANYVWLSAWQLQNINHNFLLPIDLDTYRELKNHIAKALVPLLQIWLFASQRSGSFEKRYDELCEILTLRQYPAQSQIVRQLRPSLDELTRYEYLEKWRIEKTSDRKAYKIIFFHGPKFHRDRRRRLEQKKQAEPVVVAESRPVEPDLPEPGKLPSETSTTPVPKRSSRKTPVDTPVRAGQGTPQESVAVSTGRQAMELTVLAELTSRGVMQSKAGELVQSLSDEHLNRVADYIDLWDSTRPDPERGKGPGLLIYLIEKGDPLPPTFETRRQRENRQADERRRENQRIVKGALTAEYEEYRKRALDRFIADELTMAEFDRRVETRKKELATQATQAELGLDNVFTRPATLESMARRDVRFQIEAEMNFLPYEEFRKRELSRILAERHIDPVELGIDLPKPDDAQA